jgi:hypothetical protein
MIPGSPEVANFIARNPDSPAARLAKQNSSTTGSTLAHTYAAAGELDKLAAIIEKKNDLVWAADANGWTPLHEVFAPVTLKSFATFCRKAQM